MKFRYLDHTADIKFQAYGDSLEEAFSNSALAMYNSIVDIDNVKPVLKFKVNSKAKKLMTLLYEFMEELIILLDTEGFIATKINTLTINEDDQGYEIHATLSGDEAKNYETHGDIKAMTYSDMEIKEKDGKFMIQVVLDI
ncbi:archease [archaeon]|jgi:SHS2 domain-containing protein|nr:archease [archaeon]MBT4648627.1 archease [archaeon]MBT6822492.1 archease [archaeon]MBT7392166.1 archease [archaeon]